MNIVDPELRSNLLDRLRVIATLQQWLWQEATVIADEILDCELDAVLEQVPNLALAASCVLFCLMERRCSRIPAQGILSVMGIFRQLHLAKFLPACVLE